MNGRNSAIDFIKVIAMFMIVAMHTNIDSIIDDDPLTRCFSSTCGIAIPLFFMVSGFLISSKEIKFRYVAKKVYGILKFVVQIVCIYLCFEVLCFHTFPIGNFYLWFIQEGDFWQFWYLGSMALLYILSPILNKVVHSQHAFFVLSIFIFISFTAFILNVFLGFEQNLIQTFLLWEWVMYYLAGGLIRIRYDQEKLPKISVWAVLLLIVAYRVFYSVCGIGNQYLFGSGVCLLYASTLFVIFLISIFQVGVLGGANYSFLYIPSILG